MRVDSHPPQGASDRSPLSASSVTALALLAAAAVLLPGLGRHGLWGVQELEVLARVRAALGEPLHGLVRSPWLPDAIRVAFARALGTTDLAVRLPSALAMCGVVGLVAFEARRIFAQRRAVLTAVAIALAFPATLASARTALGNPIAELFVAAAIVLGRRALDPDPDEQTDAWPVPRIVAAAAAVVSLVAATASIGLLLGGTLPLLVVVLTRPAARRTETTSFVLWAAIVASAATVTWLSWHQDNGYIPILGASRALRLMDQPAARPFTATLEEVGHGMFPWLGLAVLGALSPGGKVRGPAVWLVLAVVFASVWSVRYGVVPVGFTVPAALCTARGVAVLLDPQTPRTGRRLGLLLVVLSVVVLGKDAERVPAQVLMSVADVDPAAFPATLGAGASDSGVALSEALHRLGRGALAAFVLAFLLTPHSRSDEDEKGPLGPLHRAMPEWLPNTIVVALATAQAFFGAQFVSPRLDAQLSMRAPIDRWVALVDAGAIPPKLGIHRLDDDAVHWYAGGRVEDLEPLSSRRDIFNWFDGEDAAAALIPAREFAPLFSRQRVLKKPVYVLERQGDRAWLVANVLPSGMTDQNPILDVLSEGPPGTGRPTRVRFKNYVELVEWDILGDPKRGDEVEMVVTFEVLRPLPSNTQLWGRLKMGRISRVNDKPQELTGGVYPPNNWRRGDFVTHRYTFEIPRFEAFEGRHDVIFGLRRNQYDNIEITIPEGKQGDFGVEVPGKKREFATVGQIDIR